MTEGGFYKRFLAFVENQIGVAPDTRLLLAVSGGVDSMVMVDLVAKGGWDFGIVHCNFQLRGTESDEDAALVQQKAEKHQVPFFRENFQPKKLAAEKGISLQMAAREQRYQWFEQLLITERYDWIATAHHLDDQAETMLLNLTKGTGIRGLHGILPQTGNTIRPLLFAEKAELKAYAVQQSIEWREDPSNQADDYQRNYLRHHVIPALKAINPAFSQTMNENAYRFSTLEILWDSTIQNLWDELATPHEDGWKLEKDLLSLFLQPDVYLYELLAPFGFNQDQVVRLVERLESQPGKIFYSPTHVLEISRNEILLYPREKNSHRTDHVVIDEGRTSVQFKDYVLHFSLHEEVSLDDCEAPFVACIDADVLQYPLVLRHWQEGDFFHPFGMEHSKKLSDFFVDEKFSRLQKAKALVLESQGEIVWIIGDRLDNRFRITENTTRMLKITAEKASSVD